MMLPEQITAPFNPAAKTLIAMSEEIAALEKKYGTASTIVQTRKAQYSTLLKFYNDMRDTVATLYRGLRLAAINQEAAHILECKRMLGISWDKAVDLLSIPPDKVKDLKTLDQIIERIQVSTAQ